MKKINHWLLIACFLIPFAAKSQVPFKSGNIVVVRLGEGTEYTGLSVPMFLDEYTPAGVLVQSIALPTADNGSNLRMSQVFYRGDLSFLTLSPNKQFLALIGFTVSPGADDGNLNSTSTNRTIARVDYNGTINSSTSILGTDIGNGPSPISAITDDGTRFWVTHETSLGGGIRYSLIGQSVSSGIVNSGGIATINIDNAQLYCTYFSKPSSVSGGLPNTGPQTVTSLPGIPAGFGSTSQMFFADLNPSIPGFDVIYMAESSDYGLSKFSFNQATGNWVLNGTIGAEADLYRGITGVVNGTSVTLYSTRGTSDFGLEPGDLVALTDNSGYNGTFTGTPTVIKTAAENTTFRGVAMAPQPLSVSLSTKAFLQGAYNSGLSRHKNVTPAWATVLNASALNQPYNAAPFNYAGTETVSAGFFTSNDAVTTDIVDWVLLELHDATTPSTIIARKAAFIREDGKIVGLDGVSDPSFTGVGANNYYIVIRHRNHLPVRSSSTVFVNAATPVLYDFTTAQSKAFQNGGVTTNPAMKDFGGVFGMWGGNVNSNTNVKYIGLQNDALALLAILGADQFAISNNAYSAGDVNMDGTVKYIGLNNDALALLSMLSADQFKVVNEHQ